MNITINAYLGITMNYLKLLVGLFIFTSPLIGMNGMGKIEKAMGLIRYKQENRTYCVRCLEQDESLCNHLIECNDQAGLAPKMYEHMFQRHYNVNIMEDFCRMYSKKNGNRVINQTDKKDSKIKKQREYNTYLKDYIKQHWSQYNAMNEKEIKNYITKNLFVKEAMEE